MRVSVWSDRGVRCRQEEFQSSPIRTYPASLPQHTDGQRWFQPRQTDEEIWQTKDQAPPRYSELSSECFLSLAERQSSATANILCRFQSVQCARAVCVLLKEKNTETRAELPSFSIPWNRCSDPNLFVLFQEFPTFSEVSRNLLYNLLFTPTTFIDGTDLVVVVVAVVYFCSHIRQECLPRMLLLTLTLMRLFY